MFWGHALMVETSNPPQVAIGKSPEDAFDRRLCLPLPADTPFGDLRLKHLHILYNLDHVNVRLDEAYRYHRSDMTRCGPMMPRSVQISEEIIYWLKTTADDLIGLSALVGVKIESGVWPDQVKPDCIGGLIGAMQHPWILPELWAEFGSELRKLNDAANSYKHTFLLDQAHLLGRDDPLVPVMHNQRNRQVHEPEILVHTLREYVADFNLFYQRCLDELRECGLPEYSDGM